MDDKLKELAYLYKVLLNSYENMNLSELNTEQILNDVRKKLKQKERIEKLKKINENNI